MDTAMILDKNNWHTGFALPVGRYLGCKNDEIETIRAGKGRVVQMATHASQGIRWFLDNYYNDRHDEDQKWRAGETLRTILDLIQAFEDKLNKAIGMRAENNSTS